MENRRIRRQLGTKSAMFVESYKTQKINEHLHKHILTI